VRVGLHVRVEGGYPPPIAYAKSVGCSAIQIFSSNPRSYRTNPIDVPAMEGVAAARREAGIDPCVITRRISSISPAKIPRFVTDRCACSNTISQPPRTAASPT